MTDAPRPLIIDTDPGQDDAVALLVALASPEFEVLGITTVAGNVPLARTQVNARKVCELAGRTDVPVFAGCSRPMVRALRTAEEVHGVTGLDGPDLPEPTMALEPRHAVDWLVDTLMAAADASVTICPVGPLTNIAMALVKQPAIAAKVREIVLMGGGFFEGGNTTPAAEFNIYVDPHAAHVVFSSGVPLTMIPLDATHSALMSRAWMADLGAVDTQVARATVAMLEFYERFDMERYGTEGGPLHDPCTIVYLLRPDLFETRFCHVAVEIASELTMGMTVVDWWDATGNEPNCTVARRIDADGLYDVIGTCLKRYPL